MPTPPWTPSLPLVAILRGIRPDEVLAHGQALLDAGFDTLEVPTNSPAWADSVAALAAAFGDRAMVGAGTVLDHHHLDALQGAGGRLVVTPHTDPDLVREAAARGLHTLIGFATASEAFAALRAGAQGLKLFPAGVLGAAHARALRAVLPRETPLYAVGGVRPDNLAEYLAAGCQGAGLGSELYRPGQAPQETAERAAAYVQAFHAART
jgi:2-dehydro-3-deoxyphosphogalactonate aldolase